MGGGQAGGQGGGRRGGPPSIVNTALLARGDMAVNVSALGTVTPTATVTVKSQLSGQMVSIGFKEGQMVKKGQFLAQIDPRPYQQALLQAEAQTAKDEAQLANAKADLRRYEMLNAQDSVARQTVDTQAALVRQLEAQVKADQAAAGAQKLNLTYARIVSPVSGRVGLRQTDPGSYVTPGDANGIVAVAEIAPIDVAFSLPEDRTAEVAGALRRGETLSVEAYDRTGQTKIAEGRLLALDNLIDTTTGTIRAKARFANADAALFPNQFVNVKLTVSTLKGVVIAPSSAVQRGQQGLFVYVVDAARKVHVRPVKSGPAEGERTAILSGVAAGETVVTDGVDRLREGASVMTPAAGKGGAGWGGADAGQGRGRRRGGGAAQ
jgi:multidrug efflux system membrane fusion protein